MIKKRKKGFTLIELLVVVAIISLLSSVVLTSVSAAREKAAISKIVQQVRQVQTALEMYRTDHGEYPPNFENGDIKTLATNYLSNYIQSINFSTNQIKSFDIVDDQIVYYRNDDPDLIVSCEGFSNPPYIFYFSTYADNLNYNHLTFTQPSGTVVYGEYCIVNPF